MAKVRTTGTALALSHWKHTGGSPLAAPETMIFDFVQNQPACLLDSAQLFQLLWCSPGNGREGLHALAITHGPTLPSGAGLRTNGTADVCLLCTKCNAHAGNTGKWSQLAMGFCGEPGGHGTITRTA